MVTRSPLQSFVRAWVGFSLGVLFLFALPAHGQRGSTGGDGDKGQASSAVGTWRGESKCLVKPSACRDEDSLYRLSAKGTDQNRMNLSANKIVNGNEINMGDCECTLKAETHSIDCLLPNGSSVHLELNGNALQGRMILRDGTVWREIRLHRVAQQ